MLRSTIALLALLALLVTGCAAAAPGSPAGSLPAGSLPAGSPAASPSTGPSGAASPHPIVVTTDMGMDDLVAIYLLLREPSVDIRAITIDGTGLVHCGPGLRNIRRILAAFGREDIPFACGRDTAGPGGTPFPDDWRASSDNMYGVVLPPVVGTEFPPAGADLLAEAIDAAPAPVTIVALGPWTTLQDLFAAHPATLAKVAGIHAMAGAFDVPGNMDTPTIKPADGVEWNVGADPSAFAAVLALDVPVTFVPLDATDDVPVPWDIVERLASDHAAAGADITYETYVRSPYLAAAGSYWWDSAAAAAFVDPGLATWEDATIAISERGHLSRDPAGRPARIAVAADGQRVADAILAGLRRGDPRPVPFTLAGALSVTWDGTACTVDDGAPTKAGMTTVTFHNRSAAAAGLLAAGVREPHTWADALAWIDAADMSNPELAIPDWIVQVASDGVYAEAGADATAAVDLPAGTVGVLCGTGEWPKLDFADGGTLTLGS